MASGNGDELDVELENLCGDLVSVRKYQPFLRALFATPRGVWQPVRDLCQEWPDLGGMLDRVRENDGHLSVAWLDHPDGAKDFSLVLFFIDSTLWSKAAVVNRALVVAKKASVAKARR